MKNEEIKLLTDVMIYVKTLKNLPKKRANKLSKIVGYKINM